MKYKNIVSRGLEQKVKDMFYLEGRTQKDISKELGLPYHEVGRFLRDDKLKNYSDDKIEAIAMADNFNPLTVITYFFQSVHHAYKELTFTAIISEMLREKIAKKISEEGVENLVRGDNRELLSQWYANSGKLSKLTEGAQKHLEGYLNLFTQVLDVQREVSYVKVVTDILRQEDPSLYRKIQRALDADPAAKKVLEALSREDVLYYWDAESGKISQQTISIDEDYN
jgi:hypothetical protein